MCPVSDGQTTQSLVWWDLKEEEEKLLPLLSAAVSRHSGRTSLRLLLLLCDSDSPTALLSVTAAVSADRYFLIVPGVQ